MDPRTLDFYDSQAHDVAARYESIASPVEQYFSTAFPDFARSGSFKSSILIFRTAAPAQLLG